MDDILILAPTRWKLKRAIRVLNETFDELKLEKHPDKTAFPLLTAWIVCAAVGEVAEYSGYKLK